MNTIHLPHETHPVDQVFTCWPAHQAYWPAPLEQVWPEFAAFLKALVQPGRDGRRMRLTILAATAEAEAAARQALGRQAQILRHLYGDVWTRDTGPVFLYRNGQREAVRFTHNGWGGKYLYPGDAEVGEHIAALASARSRPVDLVAEGGAFEFDGEGTVLTTRQCLLNPNRNPGVSEARVEAHLKSAFGVEKVLWIDEGMVADHTDGHIDNIVRFVRPGVVICQMPFGGHDEQAAVFNAIRRQLETMHDARGRKLQVLTIPGPGRVLDDDGELMPASYLNWVIGSDRIIVPTYGTQSEARALTLLRRYFKDHAVTGVRANAILTGGGAFHCVTCHVPGDLNCSEIVS
ncbi:MAG: agmatine deiminase family protein [Alphaproteobacteria bacterium]|nr:agmatine deiminase family protein [Alphaproteobacteria bacterium]